MRQLLHTSSQSRQQLDARQDTHSTRAQKQKTDTAQLERVVRRTRSKRYRELIGQLDAGGHTMNQSQVKQLIDELTDELGVLDMNITSAMLGVVAPCYLGYPYEVHTLDYTFQIVKHFQKNEALPPLLEKARTIAMRGGYAFIEVYSDFCCAVSENGAVSLIKD